MIVWGFTVLEATQSTLPGPVRVRFDEFGRLRVLRGVDAMADKVQAALQVFLGEWFLDTSIGIPWLQEILVKGPRIKDVAALLTKKIRAVRGVREVFDMVLVPDDRLRELRGSFKVRVEDGTLIQFVNQEIEVING